MSGFSADDAFADLRHVIAGVQEEEVAAFEQRLLAAENIFVTGLGRTGLMARGFAMRLMHLGRRVYHVGDVITPAISKGDLLWSEPVDIDAEMQIKMRDTEPLIALLRDTKKKKSFLDKALTIKNVEGILGIQTNEEDIILDPIQIKGEGLQIISRLDLLKKLISGVLYVKLHGIAVNFEIKNNKAKFKGLGGKKKVKKKVDYRNTKPMHQRDPHGNLSKNLM